MSILFSIYERANPRDPAAPKKFYPQLIKQGDIELYDMVDTISSYSTVNPPDVLAVLESLVRLVPRELKRGRYVKFGRLGTFYLTAKGIGKDTEEEVSAADIEKVNLRFRPNNRMKEFLGNLTFEKVSSDG